MIRISLVSGHAFMSDNKVTRYGYRKKLVVNRFIDIQFQANDVIAQLKQEFADATQGGPDNHEVYVVENVNGRRLAFQFSDWHLFIGTDIQER